VEQAVAGYQPDEALNAIFVAVDAANKYIQDQQPWTLAKARTAGGAGAATADERLGTVLYNLAESIRLVAYCLAAFLPATADKIAGQLGSNIEQGEFATRALWGYGKAGTRVQADGLLFEKLPDPDAQ
jgi:methionyl-tRNA synthetase